ncbi:glycosyltransferase family 25 protein [Amylibacter sp.]|nr:glycosyltransferase family 25 protein [Amylibacter sp.]
MKIYLINLETSSDRRAHMYNELKRLVPTIQIKRALCVDIKNNDWSTPKNIKPGKWQSDRWALGPSDIEIFRSHQYCWNKIAASKEMGIILEDDLLFSNNFPKILKFLTKLKINGIFKLDGVNLPLLINKPTMISENVQISKFKTIAVSAAAYAIDPQTAKELSGLAKINRTVDDYLFDPAQTSRNAQRHCLPIFQVEPVCAAQAQFGAYFDKTRQIPSFLEVTKRADAKSHKSRLLSGPILYRFKKEIIRTIYKYKLQKYKKNIIAKNSSWRSPRLSKDLVWKQDS